MGAKLIFALAVLLQLASGVLLLSGRDEPEQEIAPKQVVPMQTEASAALQAEQDRLAIGVLHDAQRVGYCILGAVVGALMSIAIFPPDNTNETMLVRRLALKFGCSSLGGFVVTPAFIEWMKWPDSGESLMAISFFVAVFLVAGLHFVAPRLEKFVDTLLTLLHRR